MSHAAPPRIVAIAGNESSIIDGFVAYHADRGAREFLVACNGSDDTAERFTGAFESLVQPAEGLLRLTEWVDFGWNRSELLDFAAEVPSVSGWELMLDIDWTFVGDLVAVGDWLAARPADTNVVAVAMHSPDGTLFIRPLLTRSAQAARYRGRRHEYLTAGADEALPAEIGAVTYTAKGHRSQIDSRTLFTGDAFELMDEFYGSFDSDRGHAARAAFYAAQSFRDAGLIDAWIAWSKRRFAISDFGYWQERYIAALWLGRSYRMLGDFEEARHWLEEAHLVDQSRPEALIDLAGVALQRGMRALAWHLTMAASAAAAEADDKAWGWLFYERAQTSKWIAYNLALLAPEHGQQGRDLFDSLRAVCGPDDPDVKRLAAIYDGIPAV